MKKGELIKYNWIECLASPRRLNGRIIYGNLINLTRNTIGIIVEKKVLDDTRASIVLWSNLSATRCDGIDSKILEI